MTIEQRLEKLERKLSWSRRANTAMLVVVLPLLVVTSAFTAQLAAENVDVNGATVVRFQNNAGATSLNLGLSSIGGGASFADNDVWSINNLGAFGFGNGTAALPSISFTSDPDTGAYRAAANTIGLAAGAQQQVAVEDGGFTLRDDVVFGWDSTGDPSLAGQDVGLGRHAANILRMKNGTTGQAIRIYRTYTDDTNGEWANIRWVANVLRFGTSKQGTGSDREVAFETGGAVKWTIEAVGDITAESDNTYDIGAAGATRPQSIYVGTSVDSQKYEISNDTEGNAASMNIQTATETHTLAAAGTSTTSAVTIPSGAMVLGCGFNVDTTVVDDAGDDTWSAAFVTGDTSTLATAGAAAQNTKVNTLVAPAITTAATEVQFTAQGGSFSAGVIEVVCYYIDTTSLANV